MQESRTVTARVGDGNEPRYWPISRYGVIGDCRTAALIAPNGSVDWCCLPHFDRPAIFLRLLDADKGGYFRVSPTGPADSSMSYLPGTNILETLYQTDAGRLRVVDFMPIRKRRKETSFLEHLGHVLTTHVPHGLASGMERELGNDVAAAHRISRIITCLEGNVAIEIVVKATFDYAREAPEIERQSMTRDMFGALLAGNGRYLALLVRYLDTVTGTGAPLVEDGDGQTIRLRTTLRAGNGLVAGLNYARDPFEARQLLDALVHHDPGRDLDETLDYWRDWSATSRYTGTYQHAVSRSALALKLCTFEPTGAIVAAPTTSLPEDIGGVRNWDYRYTWLRDSSFTLGALGRLGYLGEARDYFHFLHDLQIERGSDLRIMYGIRGESGAMLQERELGYLAGYRDSRPVRVGNGAATQQQLDIYGELLDAAFNYMEHEGYHNGGHAVRPSRDLRNLSRIIADYVARNWQGLDRGIWEVRGAPRAFVYSRAMCWVAMDRACRMAGRHGHDDRHWSQTRQAIFDDVVAHGYNEQLHSFVQYYGSDVLDAADLRLGLVSFLPWQDARISSTVAETKQSLSGPHALVYRYRPAGAETGEQSRHASGGMSSSATADDGLPGKEGSFLACAFWLIENLCYLGEVEEARERFEELLAFASPLGLYSEELDPDSGEQIGNYPQAFTHIGLINTAITLQQAQEGTLRARPEISGAQ